MKKWNEKDLNLVIAVIKGKILKETAINQLQVDSCQINSVIAAFRSIENDPKTKRASSLMKKIWKESKTK